MLQPAPPAAVPARRAVRRVLLAAFSGASLVLVLMSSRDARVNEPPLGAPSQASPAISPSITATPQRDPIGPGSLSPLLVAAADQATDGTTGRLLDAVLVRGRAPKTGYDRAAFGQRWADVDRNGCDTRNDVLRRDLTDVRLHPRTKGCAVLSGRLRDPYTGAVVGYARGASSDVHVDHVVALADAWQKGASQWSAAEREAFANDPQNLLVVTGHVNARKGDSDAASWLPPRRDIRCAYVAAQVSVKHAYGVSVTPDERAAITRVLAQC